VTTGAGGADPIIDAALRSIAPDHVLTGSRRISDDDVLLLLAEEAAAVARAVPRRKREFATGRVLLRSLIGITSAIPIGPDRAPVLPPATAASLAHDHVHAVAAVARGVDVALGVDVEPAVPLASDVAALVLRADERGVDAHLAFTLKEAAYKAWSRCGGRMLDHHQVRLRVGTSSFDAEIVDDGVWLQGRYARAGDRWVALVVADRGRPG
jgi:4'-phosphopantetheinyl transferase EntD